MGVCDLILPSSVPQGDEVDERNRDLATACAFRDVIVPVSKKDLSNRTTAAEYVEKRNAVVLYVNMESELTARLAGLKPLRGNYIMGHTRPSESSVDCRESCLMTQHYLFSLLGDLYISLPIPLCIRRSLPYSFSVPIALSACFPNTSVYGRACAVQHAIV